MDETMTSKDVIAVLLLCLLAASCGPALSTKPLSKDKIGQVDKKLLGTWRSVPGDSPDEIYLHIGRDHSKDMQDHLVIAMIERKHDDGIFPSFFGGYSTDDGERSYLSLRMFDFEETSYSKEYLLFKYAMDGDALSIWMLRSEAAKELIEKKALKGKLNVGKDKKPTLTDTAPNILKVVRGRDDFFELYATFDKIKPNKRVVP